ncbi:MAG: 4-phosphopantetheinyl transferase [Solirubrobacteraceae bacterium]|jgi:4'-phosphopantetheinyl transferase|nr:4-phosphopantetheinyl transferase [Solirubrobacteraceae bacterium]
MSRSITPYPSAGTVDVWRVDLAVDCDADIDGDIAVLSHNERVRLELRHGTVRGRFARAHAALRRIVATYEGVAAAAVEVSTPYGSGPQTRTGLELSLSHSHDIALVAVAATPVGVDVESLFVAERVGGDLVDMAEMSLSDRELEILSESAPHLRPVAWLRSWTRKEAWMKANGSGLADQSLPEIDVSRTTLGGHTLVDLTPAAGYVGAVALAHPRVSVNWKELRT